jgi:alanine or glycine:cation symporter, AGCS family
MTALSATIGTGNIAGVATAIAVGGTGALFWMWMTALVGMATKYSEVVLAVRYREVALRRPGKRGGEARAD